MSKTTKAIDYDYEGGGGGGSGGGAGSCSTFRQEFNMLLEQVRRNA